MRSRTVKKIEADFAVVPPVGSVHFQPAPLFHPPSLKNPLRVSTDDPMEKSNRFLDRFKRMSIDTWLYRMGLLKHATPTEAPWAVKTAVEMHQGIRLPFFTAGGPGSGCRGPNCGRPSTGKKIVRSLQSVSKKKIPAFVRHGADLYARAGLSTKYFDQRPLTKFRTADKLSIHPLAVGNYNEAHRYLELRNDATADVFTHEFAHHLDIAFVRSAGKSAGDVHSINAHVASKIQGLYTADYEKAKEEFGKVLGHRFNFTNDYAKVERNGGKPEYRNVLKKVPSVYALDSSKEWIAEAMYLYVKSDSARERIERITPGTAKACRMILRGDIFR